MGISICGFWGGRQRKSKFQQKSKFKFQQKFIFKRQRGSFQRNREWQNRDFSSYRGNPNNSWGQRPYQQQQNTQQTVPAIQAPPATQQSIGQVANVNPVPVTTDLINFRDAAQAKAIYKNQLDTLCDQIENIRFASDNKVQQQEVTSL